MERRYTPNATAKIETRADGKPMITGYSAVFYREGDAGTEFALWSDLVERIRPGAFDRAMKEKHDVRGLFNHDPNQILGRTTAGTMRLTVDNVGLRYEIDPPDSAGGVIEAIKRGDVTGSSFAFNVTKQTFQERKGAPSLRWIEDVDLFDSGPVTYPAYEGTSTGIRSVSDADEAKAAFSKWQAEQFAAEKEKRARRLRMLEIGG